MPDLNLTCQKTGQPFVVTEKDQAFYAKIGVPSPKLGPHARRQLRNAFNGGKCFWATCAITGKRIISFYRQEQIPFPILSSEAFWTDDWDPMEYGREFDFKRSFFEQMNELMQVVPRLAANAKENENSDYAINGHKNKNCYMTNETDFSRDCYYGYMMQHCRDTVDAYFAEECELCYEIIQCNNCYNLDFSSDCHTCSDSKFLTNCRGSKNCLFSVNLRNAEYCIFNVQYSKKEYEAKLSEYNFADPEALEQYKAQYESWLQEQIFPATNNYNVENSVGDHLIDCKDCFFSFDMRRCQDCNYSTELWNSRDCYDTDIYNGELLYNTMATGPNSYNVTCDWRTWTSVSTSYCIDCHNCEHCFGCISLKRKKYCIFNVQYTEETYFALRDKIIEQMKNEGTWGEFFPARMSPLSYNDTHAHLYYPLTKEQALAQGFNWKDANDISQKSISKDVQTCKASGKQFKLTSQEVAFYKKKGLPNPQLCYEERQKMRIEKNGRRILYQRPCSKTGELIWSSHPVENSAVIYGMQAYAEDVL